jgi:ferric-dicitrate binding protein FerR (iron transport regulator)
MCARCGSAISRARFRGSGPTIAVAHDLAPRRILHAPAAFAVRRQGLALAGFFLLAASLLWFVWTRPQETAQARVFPAPQPPAAPAPPVRFADGSTAQLHGASSALFTEEMSDERVRLRLSGGARFDVVPKRDRSFIVANAQVVVRVLGTVFSVDPDGARTRVAVERGRVQVMWRSGATILSAGEIALFPPENEPAFAVAPASVAAEEGGRAKSEKRRSRHGKTRAKSEKLPAR